jgi:biopolymer transport protein ExbD
MAIIQPGKRPSARFRRRKDLLGSSDRAWSFFVGGKGGRGHKATNAEINVVSMVDMMTMLVIFLLQQFSATGEVLFMQKDIKLPEAQHGQAIEVAPVVAISATQVVVTGQKVAEVADLDRDPGYLNIPALEERLREEKKRWDFMHQQDPDRDKNWKGDVNIQADVKVPFRLVKRVMYSCNQVGYFNINFATLEVSGEKPAEKPKL